MNPYAPWDLIFGSFIFINWAFLLAVLEKMGFDQKLIGWDTIRYPILMNGTPTSFFKSSRDFEVQGCSFSLFIHCGDGGS